MEIGDKGKSILIRIAGIEPDAFLIECQRFGQLSLLEAERPKIVAHRYVMRLKGQRLLIGGYARLEIAQRFLCHSERNARLIRRGQRPGDFSSFCKCSGFAQQRRVGKGESGGTFIRLPQRESSIGLTEQR